MRHIRVQHLANQIALSESKGPSEQAQQDALANFKRHFDAYWRSRTTCAKEYTMYYCANGPPLPKEHHGGPPALGSVSGCASASHPLAERLRRLYMLLSGLEPAMSNLCSRRRRNPKTSTGPAPWPISVRPLPTASAAISRAQRAASGELEAARQERRERRAVRAAGTVRCAVRVARALDARASPSPRPGHPRRHRRDRPVTTTASGPRARIAPPRSSEDAPSPSPDKRPRLEQVRRRHRRQRQHAIDQRRLGLWLEQRRAALGDHHRVDHDRRLADTARAPRSPRRSSSRPRACRPSPRRRRCRSRRPDLRDDHRRRHRGHHLDPDRVLGRQRRDRRRAVHAAPRERLQVGLDPGAAAGVRARDRKRGMDRSTVRLFRARPGAVAHRWAQGRGVARRARPPPRSRAARAEPGRAPRCARRSRRWRAVDAGAPPAQPRRAARRGRGAERHHR